MPFIGFFSSTLLALQGQRTDKFQPARPQYQRKTPLSTHALPRNRGDGSRRPWCCYTRQESNKRPRPLESVPESAARATAAHGGRGRVASREEGGLARVRATAARGGRPCMCRARGQGLRCALGDGLALVPAMAAGARGGRTCECRARGQRPRCAVGGGLARVSASAMWSASAPIGHSVARLPQGSALASQGVDTDERPSRTRTEFDEQAHINICEAGDARVTRNS